MRIFRGARLGLAVASLLAVSVSGAVAVGCSSAPDPDPGSGADASAPDGSTSDGHVTDARVAEADSHVPDAHPDGASTPDSAADAGSSDALDPDAGKLADGGTGDAAHDAGALDGGPLDGSAGDGSAGDADSTDASVHDAGDAGDAQVDAAPSGLVPDVTELTFEGTCGNQADAGQAATNQPPAKSFVLKNTTGAPVTWTAKITGSSGLFTLDTTGSTVAAGGTVKITATPLPIPQFPDFATLPYLAHVAIASSAGTFTVDVHEFVDGFFFDPQYASIDLGNVAVGTSKDFDLTSEDFGVSYTFANPPAAGRARPLFTGNNADWVAVHQSTSCGGPGQFSDDCLTFNPSAPGKQTVTATWELYAVDPHTWPNQTWCSASHSSQITATGL